MKKFTLLFSLLIVSLIGFAQSFTNLVPYDDEGGNSLMFLNPSFVKDYSTSAMILGGEGESGPEGKVLAQDFTQTATIQVSSAFQQKMGFAQMWRQSKDTIITDYYNQLVDTASFVLPGNYNSLHDFIYDQSGVNCNTFEEYVILTSDQSAWYDSDEDGNFEIWEYSTRIEKILLDTWETHDADDEFNTSFLECANNQSLPIDVTQTLFNDDDLYEMFSLNWVKYDFRQDDMPSEDYNHDGNMDVMTTSVYVASNSQIMSTSGNVVATSDYVFTSFFQIGNYVYLVGGTPVAVFTKGDGSNIFQFGVQENSTDLIYLVGGAEMDATTFWSQYGDDFRDYMNDYGNGISFSEHRGYSFIVDHQLFRIDKSANAVPEIKAVGSMRIFPNPVLKSEPVTVELGDNDNSGRNIIITSSSGQRVSQTPVGKGETSVKFNTSNMSTGVYNFSVIEKDKVVNNSKVIVK